MPKKVTYLVRRELGGSMATIQAQSVRGAMVAYLARYGRDVEEGEEFRVKEREHGDWTWFRRTASGVRQFNGTN